MDDQRATPRQRKRKADLMDPSNPQRQAPMRPVAGPHVAKMNKHRKRSNASNPPVHATASNSGTPQHPSFGNQSLDSNNQPSYPVHGNPASSGFGMPANQYFVGSSLNPVNQQSSSGFGPVGYDNSFSTALNQQAYSSHGSSGPISNLNTYQSFPGHSSSGLGQNPINSQLSLGYGGSGVLSNSTHEHSFPGHGGSSLGPYPVYLQSPSGYGSSSQTLNPVNAQFSSGFGPIGFGNSFSTSLSQQPVSSHGFVAPSNPHVGNHLVSANDHQSFTALGNTVPLQHNSCGNLSGNPNSRAPSFKPTGHGLPIRPGRFQISGLHSSPLISEAQVSIDKTASAVDDPSDDHAGLSISSSILDLESISTDSISTIPTTSFAAFTIKEPPQTNRLILKQPDNPKPYQPAKSTVFNVLLKHHDIMFQVCRWLPAADILNLYALSKRFHWVINHQLTTLITGNAKTRMPESAEVFSFKCYKPLCMLDAAQNMSVDKYKTIRDVPTFRWLKFLEFRENTVQSILEQLALRGQRLPRAASKVIKKIWFLMDMPDSKRRIGTIHNPQLWSDSELFVACMFFMKVDMAASDPMNGSREGRRFRQLMLGQRTLSVLDRVFKRELMRNQYEMLQMFTEWKLHLPSLFLPGERPHGLPKMFFGIPITDVGTLCRENWHYTGHRLIRPDEVVMKETIRRGMKIQKKLYDLMLWGNTHPVTQADVFPKDWKGEIQTVFEDEVEDKVEKDIAIYVSKEGTQVDWAV